jgi:hypothetical protein
VLSFDAQGRLVSVETNVDGLDARAGVEFFSGLLVPATEGGVFEPGTCPGAVLIGQVDWRTVTPLAGAVRRRIV